MSEKDDNNTNRILFIVVAIVIVGIVGYVAGTMNKGGDSSRVERSADGGGAYSTDRAGGGSFRETGSISELKAQLKASPNDFELHVRLGKEFFTMMQFEEAVKYLDTAIKLNPDYVDTYNDIALANHYLGNSAQALTYVEEGIKRNPYFQRIWLTRGFILAYGMGDEKEAVKSFEQVVAIDPDSSVADAARDYLVEFGGDK